MSWYLLAIVLLVPLLLAIVLRWLGARVRRSMGMAVRSLLLHKLRFFLSVLGIIIGTASVIVLMAFGEGSMRDALEDIRRQGANNLIAVSVKPPEEAGGKQGSRLSRYGLTDEDLRRFRETLRPQVIATLPLRSFPAEIRPVTEGRVYQGRIVATQPRYADLHRLHNRILLGRFLAEQDERQAANVAVLGLEVADELFPGSDPLGKKVQIKDRAFEVVGVLAERTPATGGENYNGDVYIPLRAWRERVGQVVVTPAGDTFIAEDVALSQVVLTVENTDHVRYVADLVRAQLARFHPQGDVELRVPLDRLEEAERARNRYRVLLFFIAGISLLVGGIGIMNVMLATVTERTREIGIRRALGAARGDITLQFLVEAVVQTGVGGLVGVATGFGLTYAIPALYRLWQQRVLRLSAAEIQPLPVQLHVPSVLLALCVAVAVGVLFGWYPARRAALMDPIEALRHD